MKKIHIALLTFLLALTLLTGLVLGWLLANEGFQMAKVRINAGVGEVEFQPTVRSENGGEKLSLATPLGEATLSTKTPLITETPSSVEENSEISSLYLPFVDTFDDWIRPEWTIVRGMPVVVNGRLCNAHTPLVIELKYRLPSNYTISFDYFLKTNIFNNASIWLHMGDLVSVSMDDATFRFYLYDKKKEKMVSGGEIGITKQVK